MKKFFLCFLIIVGASCSSTYNYLQVLEVGNADKNTQMRKLNNGLLYEDINCSIYYSLWASGGDVSFEIYNKTANIMYVDLSKCFFIKNGIAYDYFLGRQRSETPDRKVVTSINEPIEKEQKTPLPLHSSAFNATNGIVKARWRGTEQEFRGHLFNIAHEKTNNASSVITTTQTENNILAVPPGASRIISEYSVINAPILNCDLTRYPKEKASVDFSAKNSPLTFGNFITFNFGEEFGDISIEHKFYITRITNYTPHELIEYAERKEKQCQNLTNELGKNYEKKDSKKVYDAMIKEDISNCFYVPYQIQTPHKLYKKQKKYVYNAEYDGFTN